MADCCGSCGAGMVPRSDATSRVSTHEGRGLCTSCYGKANYRGEHVDYPRRSWSRDDLMAEWELLRSENYTRAQAADRLGVSRAAFDRAIWRAKAAGDPRAEPGAPGGINSARAAVERAREAVRAATEPPAVEAAPTSLSRELEHAR